MRALLLRSSATNSLPLIIREIRAESRQPMTYWLRVLAAAVVVAVFGAFVNGSGLDASQLGAALFAVLQWSLTLAIWTIVPMMTADCISFEKREGTLGLLFLTPLTVLDVILGKAVTHVLRAVTLVLASLPVLVLPFVMGGVSWQQVMVAIATLGNALFLGIAVGIYSSAKGGSAIQVMVAAGFYAFGLAIISGVSHQLIFLGASRASFGNLMWRLVIALCFTVIWFQVVINGSVVRLRETWDKDSATPERPDWVRTFSSSDFWRRVFHWNRGRALDHNPIAWLQEYSWTARLTKWGWFFGMLVSEFFMLIIFPGWQPQVILILALGVSFSATGSFRRERQSGALEILLVTPLTVRQLMVGRLWGICSHFFPALAVLCVFWYAEEILYARKFYDNTFAFVFPNPLAFVSLMVVGFYLSLWRLNFLILWLLAWGWSL